MALMVGGGCAEPHPGGSPHSSRPDPATAASSAASLAGADAPADPTADPAPAPAPLLFDDPDSFRPLPPSKPTGWRARFPGPGQSYVDYLATAPRRVSPRHDTLYLLPLGELETAFVVDHEFTYVVRTPRAAAMAELVGTFFGVPTRLLAKHPLESLAEPDRVRSGHEQYRAQTLLSILEDLRPDDAFSMTALMVRDVYFDDAQSFGYGFGQHRDGQAVVSFARLDPVVSGHARPADILQRLPLRGFKLLVHEVGHTFGFEHCTEHRCVMNGFADLDELDATPLHLGPGCLRKLIHATQVDPHRRYAELADLYPRLELTEPAEWIDHRRQRLAAPSPRPLRDGPSTSEP